MSELDNTDEESEQYEDKIELDLKHYDVINGIVPVEIIRLNDYVDFEDYQSDYSLTVKYKFIFNDSTIPDQYNNKLWQAVYFPFGIQSISRDNKLYLKVPLFIIPYQLEFQLELGITNRSESQQDNIFYNAIHSKPYLVDIPSILINRAYKPGDLVQYYPESVGYFLDGTVIELSEDNYIKIKTAEQFNDPEKEIVEIHSSRVAQQCVYGGFVVSLIDNVHSIKDVILRTNNDDIVDTFIALNEYMVDFCYKEERYYIGAAMWHYQHMSKAVSIYICQFLCDINHNYRVECVLDDDNQLYMTQVWRHDILKTYQEIQKGKDTLDLQYENGIGYSCDICCCETSKYEFIYCCSDEYGHVYCVSCMHSLITQYKEMKKFINECLDDELNTDCIDQIVTFCVGKICQFEF